MIKLIQILLVIQVLIFAATVYQTFKYGIFETYSDFIFTFYFAVIFYSLKILLEKYNDKR